LHIKHQNDRQRRDPQKEEKAWTKDTGMAAGEREEASTTSFWVVPEEETNLVITSRTSSEENSDEEPNPETTSTAEEGPETLHSTAYADQHLEQDHTRHLQSRKEESHQHQPEMSKNTHHDGNIQTW
jgi:hypothetical protein